jgi:hypothetical protein
MLQDSGDVTIFAYQDKETGFMKYGIPAFILVAQIVLPFLPMQVALVGHRGAFQRGIVGSDNGAGIDGRASASCVQLVYIERLIAFFGKLEGNARTDDASANNDRVVFLCHRKSCGW